MITESKTFKQKLEDIKSDRKNKFLTQLQVVFKLFAFGKNDTIYVAKFLGNDIVQTKVDESNVTSSFEVLTLSEVKTIFSYFDEESKQKLQNRFTSEFN